jgi:uncharacterized membrane protein YsdA (DUF1294 family)
MNPRVQPHARKPGGASQTSVRFVKFKLVVMAVLCALPVYGVVSLGLRGGSWLPALMYAVLSAITFGLYGHDKKQARLDGPRTPEKVLHFTELLGGWPGALVAQQVFRHKTRKLSYQSVFWLIVLLHESFWIDRMFLGGNFLARHFY